MVWFVINVCYVSSLNFLIFTWNFTAVDKKKQCSNSFSAYWLTFYTTTSSFLSCWYWFIFCSGRVTESTFLSQATQIASVLSPCLPKNVFHLPSHNHWPQDMVVSIFPPQNSVVSVYSGTCVATVIWCLFIPTYLFFILPFRMYKVLVAQLCLTLHDPMECSCQTPLYMEYSRQEYWSG